MLPQTSGLLSARDKSVRYVLIACSLVVAIILTLISIKVAAAPAWAGLARSEQTVDRAGKGDRLPLVLASAPTSSNWLMTVSIARRSVGHSLPEGCEALASLLARSAAANTAGRCVS